MKKIFFLLILFPLLLAGCRKNQVEMPNPIVESSFEEIQQKLGITFGIPKDAENIYYSIISDKVAQADFIWQETECTARIKPSTSTELEDISGYYYEWDNELEIPVGYNSATARWSVIEDQTIGIVIWQDIVPGLTYCVSMRNNATLENLFILANAVFIPLQGDS
ncbi:MAG: hypothetical protein IJQ86_06830 [Spirochaetia bacterium]|nr:hypothetical protein [Spirochaetia bacterium]